MVARKRGGTRAPSRGPVRPSTRVARSEEPARDGAGTAAPGEAVYLQLRDEIAEGELLPQQRLVEADLCARLHTSRATVRAVLLRLEHEGLVAREPYRGAHVRAIDEKEAVEITEARAALEALAARHAAIVATDDDLAALRAIHAEMQPAVAKGDLSAYLDANRRLHASIVDASRHATAQRLLSGLRAQLVRYQYRTIFLVPGRAQRSLAEHTAVVDAIVQRDPERAEATMMAHVGEVATTMQAVTGREAPAAGPFA